MTERRHKRRLRRPVNAAYCLALLFCVGVNFECYEALKLNPVKALSVKLDIAEEAASIVASINDAKVLASGHDQRGRENTYSAIRILQAASIRWKSIENKLVNTLSSDEPEKLKLFDNISREVTLMRAYLAKLYSDVNEFELAAREYEAACPTAIDESTLLTNVNPEEWLICISNFLKTHIKARNLVAMQEFQEDLVSRMPWFSGLAKDSAEQPNIIAERLAYLSKTGRRRLASELATAWLIAERMRTELKEASQEFTLADSYERRKLISLSSEKYLESLLVEYMTEVSDITFNKSLDGEIIGSISIDELELDASITLTAEAENQLIASVREGFHAQIKKEGHFYLSTMEGIIDKGRSYVQSKFSYTLLFLIT